MYGIRRCCLTLPVVVVSCQRRWCHSTGQPGADAEKNEQEAPSRDDAAAASAARREERATRKSSWLRMDPVMKWTTLVDLGRHAPLLLHTKKDKRSMEGDEEQSCANSSVAREHAYLCAQMPYAVRLQLTLSLLMWVRALRDVQDTLARLRLPYGHVQRVQDVAVATVFPTRVTEYWADAHSTVMVKTNTARNDTAEQIPAPHTWDPETSVTIEDSETESTVVLSDRLPHGHLGRDKSTKLLLDRVQGTQARPSEDDATARRLQSGSGRRRRLLSSSSRGAAGAVTVAADPGLASWTAGTTTRQKALWAAPDVQRKVPAVSFDAHPQEDEAYHGNTHRAEGCPLTMDGKATSTPIYIELDAPNRQDTATVVPYDEQVLRACVRAHAAILSSLFIEGRTVRFSTNHATVAAYVRWALAAFIKEQYIAVEQITTEDKLATVRPFYPEWVARSTVLLLPPRTRKYTSAQLRHFTSLIVQAMPCHVLVEAHHAAQVYIDPLKTAVQQELQRLGLADRKEKDTVSWVPIGQRVERKENSAKVDGARKEAETTAKEKASRTFTPRVAATSTSSSTAARLSVSALRTHLSKAASTADERWQAHSRRQEPAETRNVQLFLQAVTAVLDNFYGAEILYAPSNCVLSRRQFTIFLWKELPGNLRVVGVNTSPCDVLFYYPQAVFLTQKVGNAFRYRAIERSCVAKWSVGCGFTEHPLRWAVMMLHYYWRNLDRAGLHAALATEDRQQLLGRRQREGEMVATPPSAQDKEVAADALQTERVIEYLANPDKATLLGVISAKLFSV